MDAKTQIFNELKDVEAAIDKLKGSETASKKQTDLEIAILREQVGKSNDSRAAANKKIASALNILKALK